MEKFEAAIEAIEAIRHAENLMFDMRINLPREASYDDVYAYENIETTLYEIRLKISDVFGVCKRNHERHCDDCMMCLESPWS